MKLIRTAAISGFIVFFIGVIVFLILGFLKPGYDMLQKTVSELGESGGVNSAPARIFFIISGICEIVFAAGLYYKFRNDMAGRAGAISIAAMGLFDSIGSGVFPCDPGGTYVTFSGKVHYIVSVIGVLMIIVIPLFFRKAFWKERKISGNENAFDILKISTLYCVITVVNVLIFAVSFFSEILIGITQRLMYYTYYLWVLYVSIRLLMQKNAFGNK